MGSIRLRRIGIGGAVALVLHALVFWGLSTFNSQPKPVDVPVRLSLAIWPDLSRIKARPATVQAPKSEKVAAKSKISVPVQTDLPDASATHPQGEAPAPVDLSADLASALRARQVCQKALTEGKDLPSGCSGSSRAMAGLPLLPKDKAEHWDRLVAAQEAYRRYKTAAGNTDYWKRVTGLRNYRDDIPRLGAYSDPKWQKFFSPDINPDSAYQRQRDGN